MNAKAITATALAVLIGILLALLFYAFGASVSEAATIKNVNCGQSIASAINNDSKSTATRFVLEAGCTLSTSATLIPSEGDEVVCAKAPTFRAIGPAFDTQAYCHVHSSTAESVFRPIGKGGGEATVYFEGLEVTGGNYGSRTGSGAGFTMGQSADDSRMYGVHIHDNEAAGILSGRGTFERVEVNDTTTVSGALGVNAAGIKVRHEVVVFDSYFHDNPGNGLWADNEVYDTALGKFHAYDNVVVGSGRAGIRWEEVSQGEALIENNLIHGNSQNETRGGVSVRDAKDATIRNNTFGSGLGYPKNGKNIAIRADDSGRSDRPDTKNILITGNNLNGETIRSCGGPVSCSSNTP
jgi:type II secretory pathway pseudopilin PulG